MKVLMKPIEMVTWTDPQGKVKPIRFRIDGEVVKVAKVCHMTEETWAKQRTFIYQCQSEINGQLRTYELKFDLQTCKWYLYKM
jgi:hypothetical protein